MFTLVICVIDLRTHQPLNVNCHIQRAFSSVERMLICNKLKRAHSIPRALHGTYTALLPTVV